MARIDDYRHARRLATETLASDALENICARSGYETADGKAIRIPFLDRSYRVTYPDFTFADNDDGHAEVPIQEQVLILHYLESGGTSSLSGRWVAYREIQGAAFYNSAFVKRAIDPLKKVFGNNVEGLAAAAGKLGARPIDAGDAGFEIWPLPKVPLQLVLHAGDEEFPPEANILFDHTVEQYLSPEDAAWLAGMVVYRLIALSR